MAFKLVKRNKLRVPVKGAISGEDGHPVKFSFVLLCKRIDQAEIDAEMEDKEGSFNDFLHRVVTGWEDVADEDGQRMEYSAEAFDAVLQQPAMRTLCFQSYMKEVGAVAKN